MNRVLALVALAFLGSACDPDRHKKCEWYLVAEPDQRDFVKPGWVSLCARNYVSNKQRCFIQAKFNFAEKVHGKAFKFTSLELDESIFPPRVVSIKPCKPEAQK